MLWSRFGPSLSALCSEALCYICIISTQV
uniref:Uncharacterized protein n=1 Tax=Arundo donax TaxID=35708 RepID=A0A0A9EMN2_ARUDO